MANSPDLSHFSLLELFGLEVETQAEVLNENLLALEAQLRQADGKVTPQTTPLIEALMRASHSIKGAARIVQIEPAVKISHIMEDCFTAVIKGQQSLSAEAIDKLLRAVDFLGAVSKVEETILPDWLLERSEEIEQVIGQIGAILGRRASDRPTHEPDSLIPDSSLVLEKSSPAPRPEPSPDNIPIVLETLPITVELSLDDIFPTPGDEEEEATLISTFYSSEPTQPELSFGINPTGYRSPAKTDDPDETDDSPSSIERHRGSVLGDGTGRMLDQETIPLTPTHPESKNKRDRFLRVSTDNLNRLMGLAGEALVEATSLGPLADSLGLVKKNQRELAKLIEKLQLCLVNQDLAPEIKTYLSAILQKERESRAILSDRAGAIEQYAYRSFNLSERLYREVISTQMRPFEEGVQSFPRMVRDLGRQLNKQVKFEVLGKNTLVDRDILRKLEAPLTHILRNAVDHGIESSEERRTLGKPTDGTLRIEATHRYGMLSIAVSDDGRGIDPQFLRQSIVEKQLVTPQMAEQLSETELMEFIFLPSFSTSDQVTEISGRGVGLNIAKTMVQEVGGTLQALSKPGQGMSFNFQLPLTLSVIRTLLVTIADEPYAFPLSRIDQLVSLDPALISTVENRQYFTLNDQHIGLVRADQVLQLTPTKTPIPEIAIVIVNDQLNRYGIVVDRFMGEKNLVVRPLDPRLGKVPDISAAAILEDGSPVLILDVQDLVRSMDKILSSSQLTKIYDRSDGNWNITKKRVLVVDDSITVREMERKILQNRGYQVDIAVDGMEGWNAVRVGKYDLVISDVDMPRMNGIQLVEQIKKHPQLQSVPTIIVSYKDREEDRLQGLEAGADYYLTKTSFQDDTFINAVIDLIG